MAKASPQHQARSPGDIIVLPRVTVHGSGQPAADVEDVCLADLGLARGFLGNVIPFRRLKPSQAATPDCVVSLATRPAPLPARLSSRRFWLALAVTVAAHAAAFAIFLQEPPPLASIRVEAVSVELVVGDNRLAGNGEVTSESQITDTAPPAPEVANELMQPPEQSEKTSEAADKPTELVAVGPTPAESKPAEPDQKTEQPARQSVEEKAEAKSEPQVVVEEALQKTTEPEKPVEKPPVTAAPEPETPKPIETKPVETKPVEPPVKPVETKKPVETRKPVETKRADTKKKQEAKSKAKPTDKPSNHERAAAPAASQQVATRGLGIGQSSNNTNYTSLVRGHLMRHRAAYSGRGVATVQFSLSGSGAVTAARLTSSSGDPKLDEIAVSMVRRASPFPASPDGRSNTFSIPIKPD